MNDHTQAQELLGATIRDLRRRHGMTLREMAEKTGLSTGFLSKVERGFSQPSINNLHKICYALHIAIDDLALPKPASSQPAAGEVPGQPPLLVQKESRSLIYSLNNLVRLESILSSSARYKLDAMTLTGGRVEYASKHRYDEIGIVAQGRMEIQLENGPCYVLGEGDVLRIPADTEHTVRKLSEDVCVSYWFKLMEEGDDGEP